MLALTLALAALPALQEYEFDLPFDEAPQWWMGGSQVDISGDWIVVNGSQYDLTTGLLDHGVRLYRRTASGSGWEFDRTIIPDTPQGASLLAGGVLDGEHLMVLRAGWCHPFRFDPTLDDWIALPHFSLPPTAASPQLSGGLMVFPTSSGVLSRRTLHTYAYDPVTDTWIWADDLEGPAAASGFGVKFSLDGSTLVTNAMYDAPNFGELDELHIYERTAAGWVDVQTLLGTDYTSHPFGFGIGSALGGNVLVVPDVLEALVFERPAAGAAFVQTETFACDVNPLIVVDGSSIVHFTPDDRIEVRRVTPCSGGAWAATHRLNSIHMHVGFGSSFAIDGHDLVQGSTGCSFPCHYTPTGQASVFHIPPDLNQDGIVDACQTGALEDVDSDGLLDIVESPGSRYCSPNVPTSLGAPAQILLEGSEIAGKNELYVRMLGVPEDGFGLMLASQNHGLVPNAGGSNGNLCLTGTIGRRNGPIWSTYLATENNELVKHFDLRYSPTGHATAMFAGETWYFQGWFRDAGNSNFTDAMRLYLE